MATLLTGFVVAVGLLTGNMAGGGGTTRAVAAGPPSSQLSLEWREGSASGDGQAWAPERARPTAPTAPWSAVQPPTGTRGP